MADPKSLIKDYLIGGAGRKMLQESAEEIIRDNVRLNGPELAKLVAAKLPATGKFGEGLKKIDGFKLQIFSQILAGLGEEWISVLPMDVGAKIALKQIVGGGIIGAGSGVADIIDDAGWEKAANEKADEYILRVTKEKVIACTSDMRYYPPKLDDFDAVATDPTFGYPIPLDAFLLAKINSEKRGWIRPHDQHSNQGNRNKGNQSNREPQKVQNPITDLEVMTEKNAQASGFEPSESYRRYKRTKADEGKVPTWAKDASSTLRSVHAAAILTATQWASEEMLGIKYDVLRDFLEDAKKTKNLADLETVAKDIFGRLEEHFEVVDGVNKPIGKFMTVRDIKYYVGAIDCDEGKLETKTKALRFLAAIYRKVSGEDDNKQGAAKSKTSWKSFLASGAGWILLIVAALAAAVFVPFLWPIKDQMTQSIVMGASLAVGSILFLVVIFEKGLRWLLSQGFQLIGKDEVKEETTSTVKAVLWPFAVALIINTAFIFFQSPHDARVMILIIGLLLAFASVATSGLATVARFLLWVALAGVVFWQSAYHLPLRASSFVLQYKWQNTAEPGKKEKSELTIPTPDGAFITVEKVLGKEVADQKATECLAQHRICTAPFQSGTELNIPGYLTRAVSNPDGSVHFVMAKELAFTGMLAYVGELLTSHLVKIIAILLLFTGIFIVCLYDALTFKGSDGQGRWGVPHWIGSGVWIVSIIACAILVPMYWEELTPTAQERTKVQISSQQRPGTKAKAAAAAPQVDDRARMRAAMCAKVTDPKIRAQFGCQ